MGPVSSPVTAGYSFFGYLRPIQPEPGQIYKKVYRHKGWDVKEHEDGFEVSRRLFGGVFLWLSCWSMKSDLQGRVGVIRNYSILLPCFEAGIVFDHNGKIIQVDGTHALKPVFQKYFLPVMRTMPERFWEKIPTSLRHED